MSDARALLRQQRTARRVDDPLALYSDAGKLLCKLCREHVRSETQWDDHLRSSSHVQKQKAIAATQAQAQVRAEAETPLDSGKRKFQEDGNDEASTPLDGVNGTKLNAVAKIKAGKRSRLDPTTTDSEREEPGSKDSTPEPGHETSTPPNLTRRPSVTPSQGVELQIPSRPATPGQTTGEKTPQTHRRNESVSSHMNGDRGLPSRQASSLLSGMTAPTNANPNSQDAEAPKNGVQVDESEWEAFQADLTTLPTVDDAKAAYEDATISAAPMTAEESLAQQEKDANLSIDEATHKLSEREVQRREDERDEAMRTLEIEFEEMEDYEQRVRKLKERREQLERDKRESTNREKGDGAPGNAQSAIQQRQDEKEEEDDDSDGDDEDDDEDDWNGFRIQR